MGMAEKVLIQPLPPIRFRAPVQARQNIYLESCLRAMTATLVLWLQLYYKNVCRGAQIMFRVSAFFVTSLFWEVYYFNIPFLFFWVPSGCLLFTRPPAVTPLSAAIWRGFQAKAKWFRDLVEEEIAVEYRDLQSQLECHQGQKELYSI